VVSTGVKDAGAELVDVPTTLVVLVDTTVSVSVEVLVVLAVLVLVTVEVILVHSVVSLVTVVVAVEMTGATVLVTVFLTVCVETQDVVCVLYEVGMLLGPDVDAKWV
jgi:hypothetical protein